MATTMTEQQQKQKKLSEDMVRWATEFLNSPLGQTIVPGQKNFNAINAEIKNGNLIIDANCYRTAFLLAREKGALEMKPTEADRQLAETQRQLAEVKAKADEAKAAQEKIERDAKNRAMYAQRDREAGSLAFNAIQESPKQAVSRLTRERFESDRYEVNQLIDKIKKAEKDANSRVHVPTVAELLANDGREIPLDELRAMPLDQAKEYRRNLKIAEEQLTQKRLAARKKAQKDPKDQ